jgi:hypothetical protein
MMARNLTTMISCVGIEVAGDDTQIGAARKPSRAFKTSWLRTPVRRYADGVLKEPLKLNGPAAKTGIRPETDARLNA